jgi:hypothetical protein
MGIVVGTPDLQNRFLVGGYEILPTYGGGTHYYFTPNVLQLAHRENGDAEFALNFISAAGHDAPEESLYAMLNLGLQLAAIPPEVTDQFRRDHPRAELLPLPLLPPAYGHIETGRIAPIVGQLAWSGDTARISQHIPADLGTVIYHALQGNGMLPRFAVECEAAAYAPRLPVVVRVRTVPFMRALLDGGTSRLALTERLAARQGLPMEVEGELDAGNAADFALAMLLHIRKFLGRFMPAPRIDQGPHMGLLDPASPGWPPSMEFRLAEPLVGSYPLRELLQLDPFGGVQEIVAGRHPGRLTTFSHVPPPQDDGAGQQLLVQAYIPPNLQGVLALDLSVRVEPEYARHGVAQAYSLPLYPRMRAPLSLYLRYRTALKRQYSHQLQLVTPDLVLPVSAPASTADASFLYLGVDDYPAPIATVHAGAQLLAQASVHLALCNPGRMPAQSATLHAGQPAASFVLDPDCPDSCIEAVAQLNADPQARIALRLPARTATLGVHSFAGSGTCVLPVRAVFTEPQRGGFTLDIMPEGGSAMLSVALSAAHSEDEVRYTPSSLLQYRYRYRLSGARPGGAGGWSEWRSPTLPLTLTW